MITFIWFILGTLLGGTIVGVSVAVTPRMADWYFRHKEELEKNIKEYREFEKEAQIARERLLKLYQSINQELP